MARNPRSIDPSQGPLQAFAVDLRRLREAAGDPTYRAMAVRAGFSATTLSEAAGGVRKPSLDVTLAFVEVCGGDPAEWRERWVRLDRAPAAQGASAEAEPGRTSGGVGGAGVLGAGDPGSAREAGASAGAGPGRTIGGADGAGVLDAADPGSVREAGASAEVESGRTSDEVGGAGVLGAGDHGSAREAGASAEAGPGRIIGGAGVFGAGDPEVAREAEAEVAEVGLDTIGVGPRRKWWGRGSGSGRFRVARRAALLGAVGVLVAAAVVVLPHLVRIGGGSAAAEPRASSSGSAGCPSAASGGAAFRGETYIQGTHEHSGARLDAPVVAMLPAQCMLSFSGYCIGQDLRDQRSGTPDMRWFKLLDGSGVVASAVVHGNPPPNLPPTGCPDAAAPPAVVHLRIAAASGAQNADILSTTGIDAPIVGYAAYYSEQQETGAKAPDWHELALTDPTYVPHPKWDLTDVRAAISGLAGVPSGTVPVVAVACLGGGAPTQIVDAVAVHPDHPAQTDPVQLTSQALAAAAQSACQYPTTN